jgi:hypothetical protein
MFRIGRFEPASTVRDPVECGSLSVQTLARFLPDASPWGFSPDPSYVYKGFAQETTVNHVGHKYPALAVHKTWFFNDSELSRQLDEVKREKEALKQEEHAELEEFNRVRGADGGSQCGNGNWHRVKRKHCFGRVGMSKARLLLRQLTSSTMRRSIR